MKTIYRIYPAWFGGFQEAVTGMQESALHVAVGCGRQLIEHKVIKSGRDSEGDFLDFAVILGEPTSGNVRGNGRQSSSGSEGKAGE